MTQDNTDQRVVKLMEEAEMVQNACNLSGVVHSFSRGVSTLWEVAREQGQGTDWVNTHPYCVLYASKIAHLTRQGWV